LFGTTPHAPQLIVTGVNRYLREPGFERCFVSSVVSVQREIKFREGVLNYLFDLLTLGKEASGDPRHLAAVAIEERLERILVAIARGGNQRVIGRLFARVQNRSPIRTQPVTIKLLPTRTSSS
jgi:hypothetical protein